MKTMIDNNNGAPVSLQVSRLNTLTSNFYSERPFLIKNITDENITIEVRLANSPSFISTVFYPGWNPELIIEVKTVPSNSLQYGN
jgi:hypothetical protein